MKKVELIDAFTIGYNGYSANYSIGISMLHKSLMEAQIDCEILKRPREFTKTYEEWIRLIARNAMSCNPQIVAISVRCDTFPIAIDLLEILKKEYSSSLITVIGGSHASICANSIMQSSNSVDFVIVGEGEETLPRLIRAICEKDDVSKIKGIVYRNKIGIMHTDQVEYSCLQSCSIEQYKLILDNYSNENSWFPIEAGRGCQYNCSFCCTTKMWRRIFRLYDANSVVNTLILIYKKYGIHNFQFIHDNILSSKEVIPFLELLAKGVQPYPIQWECSARIDNITDENVSLLKHAKCCSIYFGIETGSPKMQKLYRKNINLNNITTKIEILNKNKIGFIASFILGHPDESLDDISQTLALAVQLRSKNNCQTIQLHRLSFINGSDIYNKYKDDLVFDGNYPDCSISPYVEPLYTDINNKDIFSYYYSFSKYNCNVQRVLERTTEYAKVINMYSKSISIILNVLGTHSIIEILDTFIEYCLNGSISIIEEFLALKGLEHNFKNQLNHAIDFEELLQRCKASHFRFDEGE